MSPCSVKVIDGDMSWELTRNAKEIKSQTAIVLVQGIFALLFMGFLFVCLFVCFRSFWLDGTFFRDGSSGTMVKDVLERQSKTT